MDDLCHERSEGEAVFLQFCKSGPIVKSIESSNYGTISLSNPASLESDGEHNKIHFQRKISQGNHRRRVLQSQRVLLRNDNRVVSSG